VAAITVNSLRPYFFRSASAQANTGQTDWLLTPPWANYVWIMLNVTATAGTTPTVTPAFLSADPVIMDDATLYELEEFTRRLKPDMVGSGIKEKYSYHKLGVPFRQMHSWDYSGPYHGFDGFPVFARDMDMTVNSPTWDLIRRKR